MTSINRQDTSSNKNVSKEEKAGATSQAKRVSRRIKDKNVKVTQIL